MAISKTVISKTTGYSDMVTQTRITHVSKSMIDIIKITYHQNYNGKPKFSTTAGNGSMGYGSVGQMGHFLDRSRES